MKYTHSEEEEEKEKVVVAARGVIVVVAVVLRDRPADDIARDLVDGVCAANRLSDAAIARVRPVLLAALGLGDGAVASPGDNARMAERHTQAA